MEIIVTVSVLVLALAAATPSITAMIRSNARDQAYNLMAAQLSAARALAMQTANYAAVHVQMGDVTGTEGRCYAAICTYDRGNGAFKLADGYAPRPMPKGYAFGELSSAYLSGSPYSSMSDAALGGFTSFTIVFTPTGQVTRKVEGNNINFNDAGLFVNAATQLWNQPAAEEAVTAVTLFEYTELEARSDSARADYLNDNGLILPINVYTGQLFPRK
ncbi:MAG TPA: hypothetical protein DCX07_01785 [Phycisphaerales bacterium]|nr:hypothetical protein [Phycisphaerales bacterium]